MSKQTSPTFATLVQEFFTDYMVQQRALSPCTVVSYRDTFVLLLRYAQQQGKEPNNMGLTDISPKFLVGFLDHLEQERHNSVRSRNIRLAAVRSFLKFAARRDPAHLRVIEQALAVPMKRFDRKMVGFVPREQMLAVIDAPSDTWIGQRDRLMLMLMFNTGARVSESHTLDDGTPVHSFSTLMAELATIVRNTCRTLSAGPEAPTFDIVTTPNAKQRQALELIQRISV